MISGKNQKMIQELTKKQADLLIGKRKKVFMASLRDLKKGGVISIAQKDNEFTGGVVAGTIRRATNWHQAVIEYSRIFRPKAKVLFRCWTGPYFSEETFLDQLREYFSIQGRTVAFRQGQRELMLFICEKK